MGRGTVLAFLSLQALRGHFLFGLCALVLSCFILVVSLATGVHAVPKPFVHSDEGYHSIVSSLDSADSTGISCVADRDQFSKALDPEKQGQLFVTSGSGKIKIPVSFQQSFSRTD